MIPTGDVPKRVRHGQNMDRHPPIGDSGSLARFSGPAHFPFPSPLISLAEAATAYARESFKPGRHRGAGRELMTRIHEGLRGLSLPARYVSGCNPDHYAGRAAAA